MRVCSYPTARSRQLVPRAQPLRALNIALGDTTGDGVNDLVSAGGRSKSPVVSVIDGQTGQLAQQFIAFPGFHGGVWVLAADINGDGVAEIIGSAAVKKGLRAKVFDGLTGELLSAW
jgi:large repetitive protein